MRYLIQRLQTDTPAQNQVNTMFRTLMREHPDIYICTCKITNYSENLQYGATEKVTQDYVEESFVVEDVSSLMNGLMSYPTASAVGNHDIAVNYKNHFNEPNPSALGVSDANSDYYFTYGKVLYMPAQNR